VADYPRHARLGEVRTEDYLRLDSLYQIRPPYPANGTAELWALRGEVRRTADGRIRKTRSSGGIKNRVNNAEADAANGGYRERAGRCGYKALFRSHRSGQARQDWLDIALKQQGRSAAKPASLSPGAEAVSAYPHVD